MFVTVKEIRFGISTQLILLVHVTNDPLSKDMVQNLPKPRPLVNEK